MTDEKLDQLLKQALSPEIDDSEIQIRRKTGSIIKRKILVRGLAICAMLALAIVGMNFNGIVNPGTESDSSAGNDGVRDWFAITAYAAESPDGISSGDVMAINALKAKYGSSAFLDNMFSISGENIDKVRITTDKCEIYTAIPIDENDPEYQDAKNADLYGDSEEYVLVEETGNKTNLESSKYHYVHMTNEGTTYEGEFDSSISFGMSVPKELWSTNEDLSVAYHEDVDQVNGATLTIEVTYHDGYSETHHYRLETGKVYIPCDENGYLQYDKLTRFITADDECYLYGYLMEKID